MLLIINKTKEVNSMTFTINRLRELRKSRKIKVNKIAEFLGISQPYYYDLEKSSKRLNEDLLNRVADFYGVTTDYILGRTLTENGEKLPNDNIPP